MGVWIGVWTDRQMDRWMGRRVHWWMVYNLVAVWIMDRQEGGQNAGRMPGQEEKHEQKTR